MSQYDELDRRIIEAIKESSQSPQWDGKVRSEAERIARATGREEMRVTDGRLQALRKAGKIRHGKATLSSVGGWRIVEQDHVR